MERGRHSCCRPGVNTKAPRTSPHTNASKRVPKHANTSSTTRTSQRSELRDRNSNTPPPKLNKKQQKLIYDWLKPNMEHLLRTAASDLGITDAKDTAPKHCVRIVQNVFEDEGVRRFPCFANVSNAVFKELHKALKEHRKGKMCVKYGYVGRIAMKFDPSQMAKTPDSEAAENIGSANSGRLVKDPSIRDHIGKVRAELPGGGREYWKVISHASKLDLDRERNSAKGTDLRNYIKEQLAKIPGMKNESFWFFDWPSCLDLNSGDKDCHRGENYNTVKENVVQKFHQNDAQLFAKWSLSHSIATSLGFHPHSSVISPTDKCRAFWKSRFLFAGKRTEHDGVKKFKGVALDTVLARVWNADMTLKSHWVCELSAVTKKRWNRYVAPHDHSLAAFDERSRFKPREPIHLDCSVCYDVLREEGPVLLKPL